MTVQKVGSGATYKSNGQLYGTAAYSSITYIYWYQQTSYGVRNKFFKVFAWVN